MAVVTVNGMTAEAMEAIRDQTIIDADIVANHLILTRYDATTIDAGSIVDMTWANVSIQEASTGPESVLTANPGGLALKTNGELWLKASGTGNTGWIRIAMPGMTPFVVCTTATRPSNPVVGQRIWDTDLDQELMYYGATSTWMKPWDSGWGVIDDITSAVDVTISTSTITVLSTASKTLRNDRKYKITWNGTCLSFAAASTMTVTFSFWRGTAASVVSLPLQLIGVTDQQMVGGSFTYTPASTATSVWNIRAINTLASGCTFKNASAPGVLTIEDIGPAGNPPAS